MAILIVIISVMNGFEIEVKKRLLAFSPHITLRYAPEGAYEPIIDWHKQQEIIQNYPEVDQVKGTIDDHAIIEHQGSQLPISYRGIDTTNKDQVAQLEKLIIKDEGSEATADMGLDAKGLILESKATQFGINVGDTVQLYSTRNFDEIFDAYKRTERPKASEEYAEGFKKVVGILKNTQVSDQTPETYKYEDLAQAFDILGSITEEDIREGEIDILNDVLALLNESEKAGVNEELRRLPRGTSEHIEKLLLVHLAEIDNTLDDNAALRGLKSVILPKDVEIVGVYRISQQVVAPDFFLPLPLAQELSGLDEGVHALSLKLHDVDQAERMSERLSSELDYGWYPSSWMRQYGDFFRLVQMEKSMMSMVLSVVALGAAFLIMIVMFLTALQKRKEIGVMLAIGANPGQICSIFFIQGVVIGIFGVILGVILGMTILHFRAEIQMLFLDKGLDIFPAGFQGMDSLPADTPPLLILQVSIMGLVMCSLAPLLPALIAAYRDPAKSLRDI